MNSFDLSEIIDGSEERMEKLEDGHGIHKTYWT